MTDLLISLYPWTKALHVISVVAWMAGIFYLPRLFVYHAERAGPGPGSEPFDSFVIMEQKLLRLIMNPSMIATWIFGLALVATPGVVSWSFAWPWAKAVSVIAMTVFHMWLARQRRALAGGNGLPGRSYRIANEVPTLLLVVIVVSVIVKF
ncbi:CopD family protein [Frigidibacter sp. MR17.24]|uniref:CopD family protein n=1 Tax=Frigidibacter sp. MR17.24 TaxID=3127345 RepID=UPI003012B1F9